MTRRAETTEEAAAEPESSILPVGLPEMPDAWSTSMDREHPIKDGLALCQRYNVSLSGSRYEKERRTADRLDFAVYVCGGSVQSDRDRLRTFQGLLPELIARRAAFERQGKPAAAADVEATIASSERNITTLEKRIAAAAGYHDARAGRHADIARVRAQEASVADQIRRYQTAGLPVPADLETQLADAAARLEVAEEQATREEKVAPDLEKIVRAKQGAEVKAREGLASTLRSRVCEVIAATVRSTMQPRLALHLRLPDRPLPPEVKRAMVEAQRVCDIADQLDGVNAGIAPFAALVTAEMRAVLWPDIRFASLHRWRRTPPDGAEPVVRGADALMNAIL